MTCGIYAIYSTIDGSCLYVGQSKDIEARYRKHLYKLKNKRINTLQAFVEWYHTNGATESLLKLKVLTTCADSTSIKNALEIQYFQELSPKFYGKEPSANETWEHSKETKLKISNSMQAFSNLDDKRIRVADRLFFIKKCNYCKETFNTVYRLSLFCSHSCASKNTHSSISEIGAEELRKLYWDDLLSAREIGEKIGCTAQTVRNRMRTLGVPILPERSRRK